MWFAVFLILFFVLVLYVLYTPIVISVDTAKDQYDVQLQGLARVSIEAHEKELLRIKLKVFLLHFYFYPLKKIGSGTKEKAKKRNTKGRKRFSIRKMVSVLRSFKIKRVLVDIDTGDNVLNAKLYLFLGFLNYYAGTFNVNFEGRNQLVLQLHNRPIHIIRLFINY